jgi:hypothetical protein
MTMNEDEREVSAYLERSRRMCRARERLFRVFDRHAPERRPDEVILLAVWPSPATASVWLVPERGASWYTARIVRPVTGEDLDELADAAATYLQLSEVPRPVLSHAVGADLTRQIIFSPTLSRAGGQIPR